MSWVAGSALGMSAFMMSGCNENNNGDEYNAVYIEMQRKIEELRDSLDVCRNGEDCQDCVKVVRKTKKTTPRKTSAKRTRTVATGCGNVVVSNGAASGNNSAQIVIVGNNNTAVNGNNNTVVNNYYNGCAAETEPQIECHATVYRRITTTTINSGNCR